MSPGSGPDFPAWRPYLAIISARCKTLLQYRAAALAGIGTQLFWGFIKVMVFVAFFETVPEVLPMTFSQVLVYVWLGQALLVMLPPMLSKPELKESLMPLP